MVHFVTYKIQQSQKKIVICLNLFWLFASRENIIISVNFLVNMDDWHDADDLTSR